MINIAMILGCAAIGGAIGLLGRYHDNKVKKEYERGYKTGYKHGKSIYTHDDENVFMIDISRDYNFKFGSQLWDAQQIQSAAKNCGIDIYFKQEDFLKLVIRSGKYQEVFDTYLLSVKKSDKENKRLFDTFVKRFLDIENIENLCFSLSL